MRIAAVVTILALAVLPAAAQTVVPIQVSPAVIVIGAPVEWVTIHADIAYSNVDRDSLVLSCGDDEVAIAWTKSDNCGNLVAKFVFADVAAIVSAPSATLTLTGLTRDGEEFSGTQTVPVRQR